MSSYTEEEKVDGRFERLLGYYWDGIPSPLLCETQSNRRHTFIFRHLGWVPNYEGQVTSIPISYCVEHPLFSPLSTLIVGPQAVSCRIGAHYSPYVGLFRFREGKRATAGRNAAEMEILRIPAECCEKADECAGDDYISRCRRRTEKLAALYKPLIKEHAPLSRDMMRHIIILSSRGCTSVSKNIVGREILDVNDHFATAEAEAIFYYLCLSPLFCRTLEPLQLATVPPKRLHSLNPDYFTSEASSRQRFVNARCQLLSQLRWRPETRCYFAALATLWDTRFDQVSFLNVELPSDSVDVPFFIAQISSTTLSVISRIRIEFYAGVEELFFSLVTNSREALLLTEESFYASTFRQLFAATEVFFVRKLRNLVFDGLNTLVSFFDCDGLCRTTRFSRRARRHASLRVDVTGGESFHPRAPAMAQLLFGMSDFFVDIEANVNSFPKFACAVLRTLRLEDTKLRVISRVEVAFYRSAIADSLSHAAAVIDETVASFKDHCIIPAQTLLAAKQGDCDEVVNSTLYGRQQLLEINHAARPLIYCGRVEVHCSTVQRELIQHWEKYLEALIAAFQSTITDIVDTAKAEGCQIIKSLGTTPSTVEELGGFLRSAEAANFLAHRIRAVECKTILGRVECLEKLLIPIEQHVCNAVFGLMTLPEQLLRHSTDAEGIRAECATALLQKLNKLRKTTRDYVQTLSTGVTELYHLFNFETCDVAAQTCAGLRELVDRAAANIKRIEHEEKALAAPVEDSFDDFPPLLHYFEVIEQFWRAILDSTKLRSLYSSPIAALSAGASVERVREWRRLIHSSARQLRGFPHLVNIGRDQEVALAKYEVLETFLEALSSPTLRKSHWKEIAKMAVPSMRDDVASAMDMSLSVSDILRAGLLEHIGRIGEIANQAYCDYDVDNALEGMRSYAKRTHFQFEDVSDATATRTVVARSFLAETSSQIEQFVLQCRTLRRYPNVGPLVLKPLQEWEAACERCREVLLIFGAVEERCAWVAACLAAFAVKPKEHKVTTGTHGSIVARLTTAAEGVKNLHAALRKQQFSLYTAIVQDTIQDAFATIRSATEVVLDLFGGAIDQRRSAYPRLRFLSDAQLVDFQLVTAASHFAALLHCMYPSLANVEVAQGEVLAVVAEDGGFLPLMEPLQLGLVPPGAWMQQLEGRVRVSLLSAVKKCLCAYYDSTLDFWLAAWPGQVIVLALRIMHTDGTRNALLIGGKEGLRAYIHKVSDLCYALSQLALDGHRVRIGTEDKSGGGGYVAAVQAALAYELFALREVQLAAAWGIDTVTALDGTRFLQTTFTSSPSDGIRVSMMGVHFDYRMDFLGHGALSPMMRTSQWERMALLLVGVELCRRVSFLSCGGEDWSAREMLESAAEVIGGSLFCIDASPHMSVDVFARVLRGCIEAGAYLCLTHVEGLAPRLVTELMVPLVEAYRARPPSRSWDLPLGPGGAVIAVPAHPSFRLTFCASSFDAVPRSLQLVCEEVHLPSPETAELLHHLLLQSGLVSSSLFGTEEREFGDLYEQLRRRCPTGVTLAHLRLLVRDLVGCSLEEEDESNGPRPPCSVAGPLLRQLLLALVRTTAGAFLGVDGAAVVESITKQISSGLLLPSCRGAVPPEWTAVLPWENGATAQAGNELLRRFSSLMDLHHRVMLVGPRFSGKARLLERWAVGRTPLILSPALMTASDFYGGAGQRGFAARLTPEATYTLATPNPPLLILDGVDAPSSLELIVAAWLDGTRLVEGTPGGTGVALSPSLRVVATAETLQHATPGIAGGFALIALASPTSWEAALEAALEAMPEAEYVQKTLEMLLPPLVERASLLAPGVVGDSWEPANMSILAVRAGSLCSRWYAYVLTRQAPKNVLAAHDEVSSVDERLLAVRCAVMAASWSVGLSLPPDARGVVKQVMASHEADVLRALEECAFSGEVFPALWNSDIDPLTQVVLPQGWISLEEAAAHVKLPLDWSEYSLLDAQLSTTLQMFPLPSRTATLRATECLFNCGQCVLLHGGPVSGKTTLMSSTRANPDWVTRMFSVNGGFRPTEVQQTIANGLSRRRDGSYGPPIGCRFIVCIDDLHLCSSSAPRGGLSLPAKLMDFYQTYRSLSTPSSGTVAVPDLVFCASKLFRDGAAASHSAGALMGCVDVQLPPLDRAEVGTGLLHVLTAVASRKRSAESPLEFATFLDLVHGAYLRLKETAAGVPRALGSPSDRATGIWSSAATSAQSDDEGGGRVSEVAHLNMGGALARSEHLREALTAAEMVRQQFLTSLSNAEVAARVVIGVTTFYEEHLCPRTDVLRGDVATAASAKALEKKMRSVSRTFRSAVVDATRKTLSSSVGDSLDFEELVTEIPEVSGAADTVAAEDIAHAASCIQAFHESVTAETEVDVQHLSDGARSKAKRRVGYGGSTMRGESRCASAVLSYPDSLKVSTVRVEGPGQVLYVPPFTANSAPTTPALPSTREVDTFLSRTAAPFLGDPAAPPLVTPTYQTTWFTTRLTLLDEWLTSPRLHLVFLSTSNTFGMRRLFRVWCASTRVPFVWFRVNPTASYAGMCDTFRDELRSVITYVCTHSIHAVLYLPPPLSRAPEVLRYVDAIARTGDLSALFTDAERYTLSRSGRGTLPRSWKPFVFLDDGALRERVRGSLNFLCHLRDMAEVRRLGQRFPFLVQEDDTFVVPLYTEALEAAAVPELTLAVLQACDSNTVDGVHATASPISSAVQGGTDTADTELPAAAKRLSRETACEAICGAFAFAQERHETSLCQLMDFAQLYAELDSTARVRVLASAWTAAIVAKRGDASVAIAHDDTQRLRVVEGEVATLRARLQVLHTRREEDTVRRRIHVAEMEAAQKALQEEMGVWQERRDVVDAALAKTEATVTAALEELRGAKPGVVRALESSRLPNKGTLLVNSLYAVLGEVPPKQKESSNELWTLAMRRMCTREFVAELGSVAPEQVATRLSTLLPYRQELDAVRYAPALPYAQLLANFVMALADSSKFRAEDHAEELHAIAEAEKQTVWLVMDVKEKEDAAAAAGQSATSRQVESSVLQSNLTALEAEQATLTTRERLLLRYIGLVDRFSRFLEAPMTAAERSKWAECATGDTLLVAAFYTLLAMHEDVAAMAVALQEHFSGGLPGVPLCFSSPPEAFRRLLYQTHGPRAEALTAMDCEVPWPYQALLLGLVQRRAPRWTVVRGHLALLEPVLHQFLSLGCTNVVSVSAEDPDAKACLIAAMRHGDGVLLRDAESSAAMDLIHSLQGVYDALKAIHTARACQGLPSLMKEQLDTPRLGKMNASTSSDPGSPSHPTSIQVEIDGERVPVDAHFFMVCTAAATSTSRLSEMCSSASVFFVGNPFENASRVLWRLSTVVRQSSVSTKLAAMHAGSTARRRTYFQNLQDFMRMHDLAAELLSADMAEVGGRERGDELITAAEQAMARLDDYEGQLTHSVSYSQSRRWMTQEGWDALLPAMEAVSFLAEHIETVKLGRPWNASALDGCIDAIAVLSPRLLSRIAPMAFSELSTSLKCFYALVHYLHCVIELLAPGWPAAVRGIFSTSIVAAAMAAAPEVFTTEARVQMLSGAQWTVFRTLLYRDVGPSLTTALVAAEASPEEGLGETEDPSVIGDTAKWDEEAIRRLYAASPDEVLRRVAHGEAERQVEMTGAIFGATEEATGHIVQLFRGLMKRKIEQANQQAGVLYTTFMLSVTSVFSASQRSSARTSARASLAEGARQSVPPSASATGGEAHGHDRRKSSHYASSSVHEGDDGSTEVVTFAAQLLRAACARQPLCIVYDVSPSDAIAWLREESKEAKWTFVWYELPAPPVRSAVATSSATGAARRQAVAWTPTLRQDVEAVARRLVTLAQERSTPGTTGTCLALVVHVPAESHHTVESVGDLVLLQEEWRRLLSIYAHTPHTRAADEALRVSLVVLCTAAAEELLWDQSPDLLSSTTSTVVATTASVDVRARRTALQTVPCGRVALPTATPQLHLGDLLRPTRRSFISDGVVQLCDEMLRHVHREIVARSGGDSQTERRNTRVRGPALAKLLTAEGEASLMIPLSELPSTLTQSTLHVFESHVEELRNCALFLRSAMLVAYVASLTRLRHGSTYAHPQPLSLTPTGTFHNVIANPDPLLRLDELLSAWVRRRYEDLLLHLGGALASRSVTARDARTSPPPRETASPRITSSSPTSPPPGGPGLQDPVSNGAMGYGLQAYYAVRRQQPGWDLVLQKMRSTAAAASDPVAASILRPELFAMMAGGNTGDAQCRDHEGTSSSLSRRTATVLGRSWQRQQQSQLVDEEVARWRTGIVVLARRFALQMFALTPAPNASTTTVTELPHLEQQAQWHLLRALIDLPARAEKGVACLWHGGAGGDDDGKTVPQLWLAAERLETFRAEVSSYPSDLLELCGDAAVAERVRQTRTNGLRRALFSGPVRRSHVVSTVPAMQDDGGDERKSVPVERAAVTQLTVELSAAFAREGGEEAHTVIAAMRVWEQPALLRHMAQFPEGVHHGFAHMVRSFERQMKLRSADSKRDASLLPCLHLWLPALQYPLLDLEYATSAGVPQPPRSDPTEMENTMPMDCRVSRTASDTQPLLPTLLRDGDAGNARTGGGAAAADDDGDDAAMLVLVVTEPGLVTPTDVVLCGAQLSPALTVCITGAPWWKARAAAASAAPAESLLCGDVTVVVVVRRLLAYRHLLRRAGQDAGDVNATLTSPELVAAPHIEVEMGMPARAADVSRELPSSPAFSVETPPPLLQDSRLLRCRTTCPFPAITSALWDTTLSCNTSNRVANKARPGKAVSTPGDGDEGFFMTELDKEAGSAPRDVPMSAVSTRLWAFSEVPIPVHWRSAAVTEPEEGRIELYLCIEREGVYEGERSAPTTESLLGNDMHHIGTVPLRCEPLALKDTLDVYVAIE